MCESARVCVYVHRTVCACVFECVIHATVGSLRCVSARVGPDDCDWRREPLRPEKGLCSPTMDPLNGAYLFICSYLTIFV